MDDDKGMEGKDEGANMIPGGEWNVALDVHAFNRLLRTGLPIVLFPCAGIDGGFIKDQNNSYWQMPKMDFISEMDIKLQRYISFAFTSTLKHDFLRSMDYGNPEKEELNKFPSPFHMWETPVWIKASRKEIVYRQDGSYEIISRNDIKPTDRIVKNTTKPCNLTIRDDGRFLFEYTDKPTNVSIFFRDIIVEHEQALQQAFPKMLQSYVTPEKMKW